MGTTDHFYANFLAGPMHGRRERVPCDGGPPERIGPYRLSSQIVNLDYEYRWMPESPDAARPRRGRSLGFPRR